MPRLEISKMPLALKTWSCLQECVCEKFKSTWIPKLQRLSFSAAGGMRGRKFHSCAWLLM